MRILARGGSVSAAALSTASSNAVHTAGTLPFALGGIIRAVFARTRSLSSTGEFKEELGSIVDKFAQLAGIKVVLAEC